MGNENGGLGIYQQRIFTEFVVLCSFANARVGQFLVWFGSV